MSEKFGYSLEDLKAAGIDKNGCIDIAMTKIYKDPENKERDITSDILTEVADNYNTSIRISPVLRGHPNRQSDSYQEYSQLGEILKVWLSGEILWGKARLNQNGIDAIMKQELNSCSICIPPEFRLPNGELVGETGVYIDHLALLGSSTPQVLELPPINKTTLELVGEYENQKQYAAHCYTKQIDLKIKEKKSWIESWLEPFKKDLINIYSKQEKSEEIALPISEEVKKEIESMIKSCMTESNNYSQDTKPEDKEFSDKETPKEESKEKEYEMNKEEAYKKRYEQEMNDDEAYKKYSEQRKKEEEEYKKYSEYKKMYENAPKEESKEKEYSDPIANDKELSDDSKKDDDKIATKNLDSKEYSKKPLEELLKDPKSREYAYTAIRHAQLAESKSYRSSDTNSILEKIKNNKNAQYTR